MNSLNSVVVHMEVENQISDVKISDAFLVLPCLAGLMGNIVGSGTAQLCWEVCFRIRIDIIGCIRISVSDPY
jgi:hypothetical protein